MRRGRLGLVHQILIAAFTLVVYSGSLNGQFVSDDTQTIRDNLVIRSLDWNGVAQIFRTFDGANYMPIKVLSLAVDYRLWGGTPRGYHVTNLLLHVLCATFVYRILLRLEMPAAAALATALLWSVHPLQVESVAWMSERKNVLSGLFFFWAFLTYVSFSAAPRGRTYAALLLLYILALLSKMNTIVLPAVCLAYEFAFRFRIRRSDLMASVPLFVLGVMVVVYNLTGNPVHGGPYHGGSALVTWLSTSVVVIRYLGAVILPIGLRPYYHVPLRGSPFSPVVVLSLLGLAAITAVLVWTLAKRRASAFWILWFGLTLSPMLNIIPFRTLMQDRYMYLPLLGPLAFLATELYPRTRQPTARRVLRGAAAAAVVLCAALTYRQVKVWDNPVANWQQWAQREWSISSDAPGVPDPDSARKLAILRQALERDPASAVLHNNIGALEFDAGHVRDAVDHLEQARQLGADEPVVLLNLGRAYRWSSDLTSAQVLLQRAVQLDPYAFFTHLNLARVYLAQGDAAGARTELEACERTRPIPGIHTWLQPEYEQLRELEGH